MESKRSFKAVVADLWTLKRDAHIIEAGWTQPNSFPFYMKEISLWKGSNNLLNTWIASFICISHLKKNSVVIRISCVSRMSINDSSMIAKIHLLEDASDRIFKFSLESSLVGLDLIEHIVWFVRAFRIRPTLVVLYQHWLNQVWSSRAEFIIDVVHMHVCFDFFCFPTGSYNNNRSIIWQLVYAYILINSQGWSILASPLAAK